MISVLRLFVTAGLFGLYSLAVSGDSRNQFVEGITLETVVRSTPRLHVLYLLTVDPTKRAIKLVHASGGGCSREPVSSIVERVGGLAGLNANNYRRGGQFNGNAVDFLKIDQALYADPGVQRSVIAWQAGMNPLIGPVSTHYSLKFGKNFYPVHHVNQPHVDDKAVLYTPAFGCSTRTRPGSHELVIEHGCITHLFTSGNTPIPSQGLVYSLGRESGVCTEMLKVGQCACFSYAVMVKPAEKEIDVTCLSYIASGAGLLVSNSVLVSNIEEDFKDDRPIVHTADEVAADFSQPSERAWLIHEPHPRTAVGIRADGTWLFIVADGRQDSSLGLTLPELAQVMLERGCSYALNMGGGGCSTLYLKGSIINRPSGAGTNQQRPSLSQAEKRKHERPVCAAFVIF